MGVNRNNRPVDRVSVLMYHRIGVPKDEEDRKYCVHPGRFREHMLGLAHRGMRACPIDAFFAWLDGGAPLPEGSFLLTFDDGFLGIYEEAFPLLREFGWPFTVFLVSGLIGETDVWNAGADRPRPTSPLLGRDHILEMARAGVSFQSHTRHHLDLTRVEPFVLEEELAGSKVDLESLLGQRVPYLAYPFGRLDERVAAAARAAGYEAAFSVQPGFNRIDVDRFRIRRLDVFGTETREQVLRKLQLGTNDGSMHGMLRYFARRARRLIEARRRG